MTESAFPTAGPGAWRPVKQPWERKYDGFHPWDLLIILDLVLLGFNFLSLLIAPDAGAWLADADPLFLEGVFWFNSLVTIVMMGFIPALWLSLTRVSPWQGMLTALGMRNGRWPVWAWSLVGVVLAAVLYGLAIGFGAGLDALGEDVGGDPVLEAVTHKGSWALLIGISLAAGIGEEILFRGVLQRWLMWWGQALVFGLAHVNQGWYAVGFIIVLSSVFGYLRHRRVPLWSLMLAHFLYDIALFTTGRLAGP